MVSQLLQGFVQGTIAQPLLGKRKDAIGEIIAAVGQYQIAVQSARRVNAAGSSTVVRMR